MLRGQSKSRHFVVAFFALAVGCLAVGIPLALHIGQELEFERADVIAGTRNSYTIARPVALIGTIGAVVAGGQLTVAVPRNKALSGPQVRQMLKRGLADLVINRGVLRMGEEISPSIDSQPVHPSPAVAALTSGMFRGLKLVRSTVVLTLPGGGRERFSKVSADFARVGRSAIRGTGHAVWRGQKIKFALRSDGSPTAAGVPFEIAAGGKLLAFKLRGEALSNQGLRIKGDSEIKIPDLRRLARALGAHWPGQINLRGVSVSGPFAWAGPVLSFPKAKVELANNEGAGVLSINTSGGKALLSGTLAFDEFDLASCFPPEAASPDGFSSGLVSTWVRRLAGALSMPMARHADADLRVSAKKVRLGATDIGSAATAITLKSGKVSVNLAELAFDGGSGTGQLSVDFNGLIPQLALRGRLTTAPLGQLSEALLGVEYLRGSGTFTADLIAHGDTFNQMLANLSGTIDAEMPQGGLIGVDLKALKTTPALGREIPGSTELIARATRRTTRLEFASASLLLTGRRIRTRNALARFDGHTARLAGQFDTKLRQMEIKMLVMPQPAAEEAGDGQTKLVPRSVVRITPKTGPAVFGDLFVARGAWQAPSIELSRHRAPSSQQIETLLRLSQGSLLRTRM